MRTIITFILALLFAPMAIAGDYLEGYYFYIVGAIPSTIPVKEMTDVAAPEFRETVSGLSKEWTERCGVQVDIWHTNLMNNDANNWASDYWFAYISMEGTEVEARAAAPETSCANDAYIKPGNMVIPSLYYHCVTPEDNPEIYTQVCN